RGLPRRDPGPAARLDFARHLSIERGRAHPARCLAVPAHGTRLRGYGVAACVKTLRMLKKVQMRGGARRPHARRTLCTLSVRPRAPTKKMGLFQVPASCLG